MLVTLFVLPETVPAPAVSNTSLSSLTFADGLTESLLVTGCSSLRASSEASIDIGGPMLRLKLESSDISSILHKDTEEDIDFDEEEDEDMV